MPLKYPFNQIISFFSTPLNVFCGILYYTLSFVHIYFYHNKFVSNNLIFKQILNSSAETQLLAIFAASVVYENIYALSIYFSEFILTGFDFKLNTYFSLFLFRNIQNMNVMRFYKKGSDTQLFQYLMNRNAIKNFIICALFKIPTCSALIIYDTYKICVDTNINKSKIILYGLFIIVIYVLITHLAIKSRKKIRDSLNNIKIHRKATSLRILDSYEMIKANDLEPTYLARYDSISYISYFMEIKYFIISEIYSQVLYFNDQNYIYFN